MTVAALSTYRKQRVAGRYEPLRHTAVLLRARNRQAGPSVVLERQKFRPSDINLMLGRVDNAQQHRKPEPVIEKPKPEPAPAPKGKGKGGAFVRAALETLIPPPPHMTGGRPAYVPSMTIGGRRPDPE